MKILIANHHPVVRAGMDHVLSLVSGIEVVATVGTTAQLFKKLEKESPDLIALEMDIP